MKIHFSYWKRFGLYCILACSLFVNLSYVIPYGVTRRTLSLGPDVQDSTQLRFRIDINPLKQSHLRKWLHLMLQYLRKENIPYLSIDLKTQSLVLKLSHYENVEKIKSYLSRQPQGIELIITQKDNTTLILSLSQSKSRDIQKDTLRKTIPLLKKRLKKLTSSTSVISMQGDDILLKLPHSLHQVQISQLLQYDPITLNFHLMDIKKQQVKHSLTQQKAYRYQNQTVHLQAQPIIESDAINYVEPIFSTSSSSLSIILNPAVEKLFYQTTARNIGNFIALVYRVNKTSDTAPREAATSIEVVDRIVAIAQIHHALGRYFQMTGLSKAQVLQIAKALRADRLFAPVYMVNEEKLQSFKGSSRATKQLLFIVLSVIAAMLLSLRLCYGKIGQLATIIFVINGLNIVTVLSFINFSLTSSGIIGIFVSFLFSIHIQIALCEQIRRALSHHHQPETALALSYKKISYLIQDIYVVSSIFVLPTLLSQSDVMKNFSMSFIAGMSTGLLIPSYMYLLIELFYRRRSIQLLPSDIAVCVKN